jgi:hypothetical protein
MHRDLGGVDRALDREQVLLGFDEQHIGAAGEQAAHLLEEAVNQRVPVGHAQADELAGGADRSDDITGTIGGFVFVASLTRDLGGGPVYLDGAR